MPRRSIARLIVRNVIAPVVLVAGGTLGYRLLEDWSWFDALYMTILTLTTIGYAESLSFAGRVFTLVLIVSGVFVILFFAMDTISRVVSGELARALAEANMEKRLQAMRGHIIVCGYGRMGRLVCREFARRRMPFVVIDEKGAALTGFDLEHGVPVTGDATSDDVLRRAGIDRARGLVTVMASDANNLFTTMSARLLNSQLFIVARVEDSGSEEKLKRAGANRVVSPYMIGGTRVAMAVLQPTVVDFIELATQTEHIDLQMEETSVEENSRLVGTTLRDSKLREELRIIIVAIKKSAGHMVFNPTPDEKIEAGDTLVAIGPKDQLDRMDRLAHAGEK